MRIEQKDEQGITWVVESPGEVDVKICPACRNAAFIISKTQPAIQKIRFQREGSGDQNITIGEVPLDGIEEHFKTALNSCPWCGFPISFKNGQLE